MRRAQRRRRIDGVDQRPVPSLQLTRKEIHNINAPLLESANMGADGILGTDSAPVAASDVRISSANAVDRAVRGSGL
jgi:hypothetical protein